MPKCLSKKTCKAVAIGLTIFFLVDAVIAAAAVAYRRGAHAKSVCAEAQEGSLTNSICSYTMDEEPKSKKQPSESGSAIWRFPSKPDEKDDGPPPAQKSLLKKSEESDYQDEEPVSAVTYSSLAEILSVAKPLSLTYRVLARSGTSPTPANMTVCPYGGDRIYFCSSFLTNRQLYLSLNCSDFGPLFRQGLRCCPFETHWLETECSNLKENPNSTLDFLNSDNYWNLYLQSSPYRNNVHNGYLKAYRMLSAVYNVNLEFPTFMANSDTDRLNKTTLEHRRFLPDGSLFCYYYDNQTGSGKAKSSPCPQKVRDIKLDLSQMEYYHQLGDNILELKLPSWKEYCARKDVC